LGTVDLHLQHIDSAQRSFRSALDLHIKELEPQLLLRLGITEAMQSRPDRAIDLNRKSHALFAEQRDWRGMKLADASLGEHYIDDREFAAARDTLEPVVAEGFRMLDLERLGHDYGHLSVARAELGDAAGARDAILEAIRFHHARGHRVSLVGDYQNLGDCLAELGDHDAALAALDTALVLSRQQELAHDEFQVLSRLVAICARHGVIPDVMPHVMDRCRALMHVHSELLTKESLLHFARSLQGIVGSPSLRGPRSYPPPDPLRLGTPAGHERLGLLLPKPQETDFAARLRQSLQDGLPGRDVPSCDELHPFLWQYKGEFFKSGNYTREFGITQERAKRHLRSMCVSGIIERQGSRKASRYALAFHR
jgi:tetratricopeptide (TPR) repeat protein